MQNSKLDSNGRLSKDNTKKEVDKTVSFYGRLQTQSRCIGVQTEPYDIQTIATKLVKAQMEKLYSFDCDELQESLKKIKNENTILKRREKILTERLLDMNTKTKENIKSLKHQCNCYQNLDKNDVNIKTSFKALPALIKDKKPPNLITQIDLMEIDPDIDKESNKSSNQVSKPTVTDNVSSKQDNTSSKQTKIPFKQDNTPCKQDSVHSKQEILFSKQDNLFSKQENTPSQQDNIYSNNDNKEVTIYFNNENTSHTQNNTLSKQDDASSKQDTLSNNENISLKQHNISSKQDELSFKQDNIPSRRDSISFKQGNISSSHEDINSKEEGLTSKKANVSSKQDMELTPNKITTTKTFVLNNTDAQLLPTKFNGEKAQRLSVDEQRKRRILSREEKDMLSDLDSLAAFRSNKTFVEKRKQDSRTKLKFYQPPAKPFSAKRRLNDSDVLKDGQSNKRLCSTSTTTKQRHILPKPTLSPEGQQQKPRRQELKHQYHNLYKQRSFKEKLKSKQRSLHNDIVVDFTSEECASESIVEKIESKPHFEENRANTSPPKLVHKDDVKKPDETKRQQNDQHNIITATNTTSNNIPTTQKLFPTRSNIPTLKVTPTIKTSGTNFENRLPMQITNQNNSQISRNFTRYQVPTSFPSIKGVEIKSQRFISPASYQTNHKNNSYFDQRRIIPPEKVIDYQPLSRTNVNKSYRQMENHSRHLINDYLEIPVEIKQARDKRVNEILREPFVPKQGSQEIQIQKPQTSLKDDISVKQVTILDSTKQLPILISSITSDSNNILLQWDSDEVSKQYQSNVKLYRLFASRTENLAFIPPKNYEDWQEIGKVEGLPLPIACTLTHSFSGNAYFFAVAPVHNDGRIGELSNACKLKIAL